jgi:hypothetical protein
MLVLSVGAALQAQNLMSLFELAYLKPAKSEK